MNITALVLKKKNMTVKQRVGGGGITPNLFLSVYVKCLLKYVAAILEVGKVDINDIQNGLQLHKHNDPNNH